MQEKHGFDLWAGKIPLEKGMATHSSILAWKYHGQRSLAGYSSWDCKESDVTEHTHLHTSGNMQTFPQDRNESFTQQSGSSL